MFEGIIANLVSSVIPPEYMPLVIIALTALVSLEQWLAATKKIKANSTLQFIVGIVQKFLKKNEPAVPVVTAEVTPVKDDPSGMSPNG